MRWRAGMSGPLQSSTARAVLFSALTTMTAFGSLALSVVEVCGDSDHDTLDFFSIRERALSSVFECAQNLGGNLRRSEDALANLEADHRAGDVGEGVARAIRGREFVAAESHVALDRANHSAIFARVSRPTSWNCLTC